MSANGSIRTLLVDMRLYIAEGLSRRNLMSNRDAFDSTTGSYSEKVIALSASMPSHTALDLLTDNKVTVLRCSSPVEVTVVLPLAAGTFTTVITNLMVLSTPITSLSVRNSSVQATDLILVQI